MWVIYRRLTARIAIAMVAVAGAFCWSVTAKGAGAPTLPGLTVLDVYLSVPPYLDFGPWKREGGLWYQQGVALSHPAPAFVWFESNDRSDVVRVGASITWPYHGYELFPVVAAIPFTGNKPELSRAWALSNFRRVWSNDSTAQTKVGNVRLELRPKSLSIEPEGFDKWAANRPSNTPLDSVALSTLPILPGKVEPFVVGPGLEGRTYPLDFGLPARVPEPGTFGELTVVCSAYLTSLGARHEVCVFYTESRSTVAVEAIVTGYDFTAAYKPLLDTIDLIQRKSQDRSKVDWETVADWVTGSLYLVRNGGSIGKDVGDVTVELVRSTSRIPTTIMRVRPRGLDARLIQAEH